MNLTIAYITIKNSGNTKSVIEIKIKLKIIIVLISDRIYYFLANLLELITIGVLNVGYTQMGRVCKINKYDR